MDPLLIKTYRTDIGDSQIHMMRIHPHDDSFHRHSFFELVYVTRGTAIHHLGDETASLSAGDYFIIDTGSTHCYQKTRDFEIVNCLFLPEYVDRALANCPSLSALLSNQVMRFGVPVDIRTADRICHDSDGIVGRLIRTMEEEYASRRTGYMELLRCYLTQVLVMAVRACEAAERARAPHAATEAMARYLRTHFAEPLSLNDLSRQLGYTPQYLSSLFRRDTGMSLQLFLQRLRVEEACRLMSRTDLTLTQLAQAVGYGDTKHFSRVFRRHKGLSPKEFRSALL